MTAPDNIISHDRGTTQIAKCADDMVRLKRTVRSKHQFVEIDAIADYWSIATGSMRTNQVQLQVGGETLLLQDHIAILVPPFTVLRWTINPGQFEFYVYNSSSAFLSNFDETALRIFEIAAVPVTTEKRILVEEIRRGAFKQEISLKAEHYIASQIKSAIDKNFDRELTLESIALSLKISPAVMSRYFKDQYGLSPVVYRNKLRVFKSHFLLAKDAPTVTDVSMEVGFNNLRHFNREFSKVVASKPSDFT